MHSFRLWALCTFEHCLTLSLIEWDHGYSWTHRNSNKGGLFQLDYMLVSEHVQGEACVVRGGYLLNSDHWTIDASLRLERKESWGTVNHNEFSQRGWAPKTDEPKANLHEVSCQGFVLRLWCQLRRTSTRMQLGSTLTTQPYNNGADFRNTGNALQSSGLH